MESTLRSPPRNIMSAPGLRYKNLGKTGLRVSNIGLGMWSIRNEDEAEEIVMTAIKNGITLFDISKTHCDRGEEILGGILQKRKVPRSSVVIVTKVYWRRRCSLIDGTINSSDERGLSRKHIIESVKASLERLQVEYIDIILLHKVDPACPMEEIVRAMNFVIEKGWCLYWGTARWSPKEIMEAFSTCRQFNCMIPLVEQTEYHMFCREKAELYMPELFHKIGVGTMTWSILTTDKGFGPKDWGLFAKSRFETYTCSFTWYEEDEDVIGNDRINGRSIRSYEDKLRALAYLANRLTCSLSQLAIAWCIRNENIKCSLIGASSLAELTDNIRALQFVPKLTDLVMAEIELILDNHPRRPRMVSTLMMRNQQNNNVNFRIDMAVPPPPPPRDEVRNADLEAIERVPTPAPSEAGARARAHGGAAAGAAADAAADVAAGSVADAATGSGAATGRGRGAEDGEVASSSKNEPAARRDSTASSSKSNKSKESSVAKENRPKFFLNNAGEVIKRTERNGVKIVEVMSVSSIKGKKKNPE